MDSYSAGHGNHYPTCSEQTDHAPRPSNHLMFSNPASSFNHPDPTLVQFIYTYTQHQYLLPRTYHCPMVSASSQTHTSPTVLWLPLDPTAHRRLHPAPVITYIRKQPTCLVILIPVHGQWRWDPQWFAKRCL